jgi:hypothetical protein
MLEITAVMGEEKAITVNTEAKENTSAKTTENLLSDLIQYLSVDVMRTVA